MRVLIIGGTGFLGSRTVQALAKLPDAHVTVGYRKRDGRARQARANRPIPPSTQIDLNDPSTFSEMKKHDFVVNTSDTLAASPTLAIDYALDNGVRFVEAGAHSGTMEELMRRTRAPAADKDGWTGTLLLGMGLFPGLSNLLARQLLQWVGPPDRLDIVVRLNPLAGGGPGLVELMVRATQENAVYYEGGKPEFVEINVVTGNGDQLALRTNDGVAATAHALAASVATMATSHPPPGAYLPDELLGLGDVMNRVLALAQGGFRLTLHSDIGAGRARDRLGAAHEPSSMGSSPSQRANMPRLDSRSAGSTASGTTR